MLIIVEIHYRFMTLSKILKNFIYGQDIERQTNLNQKMEGKLDDHEFCRSF